MATGKARPDKPENHIVQDVVTPAFGRPEDIARREVLEPDAKSAVQIAAEKDASPTGEEIHQKAREKSPDTAEGKARIEAQKTGQKAKPTVEDIVREATEEKKARLSKEDEQAQAVRKREEEVRKVKEAEQKERDEAAKKSAEQAAKPAEQATKPAEPRK